MSKVKVSDLKLGDVIAAFDGPFSTAIVINVDETSVKLFRPYGTTADFTTSAGLIPYTGAEHYSLFRDSSAEYEVFENKGPFK
jgi:hypothetical protein